MSWVGSLSTLLWEVFLQVLWFSPLLKNQYDLMCIKYIWCDFICAQHQKLFSFKHYHQCENKVQTIIIIIISVTQFVFKTKAKIIIPGCKLKTTSLSKNKLNYVHVCKLPCKEKKGLEMVSQFSSKSQQKTINFGKISFQYRKFHNVETIQYSQWM